MLFHNQLQTLVQHPHWNRICTLVAHESRVGLRPLFSSPVSPSLIQPVIAGGVTLTVIFCIIKDQQAAGRCTMSSAVNRIGISRLKYLDSSLNNDNHARGRRGLINDCPVLAFPGLAFGLFCGLDSDTSHLQTSRLRLPLHHVTCCCLGLAAKFTWQTCISAKFCIYHSAQLPKSM